ncbi:phage major capsid protein [Bradyrhizobium sp. CCBAU 25338]|uniref:phage major capsid protein n=1 Tax=Bradyrhizobium sp. CCBAU 25338 TaxID=1641877 RepID=UPI002302BDAA|nr:phage major capsid protein [Bradyrhizobium sp. CCBAU 25338]
MSKHFSALEFKDAEVTDPVELVTKSIDDLTKSVDERLKALETKGLDPKLVERLTKLEAKANRPGAAASTDEAKELERKSINAFMRGEPLDGIERKSLTIGGSPTTGADLVAPQYLAQIITKLVQFSPMRAVASAMGVGTGKVFLPIEGNALSGTWVTETGSRSETNPDFGQVEIDAFEHAAIVPVSRQLLEDSIVDLSGYLSNQISKQFGKAEATAFVSGDGNGKPTGFLNTPSAFDQVVAKQDGSNILDKLISLFYALPDAYASQGVWFMNRTTQGVIRSKAVLATNGILWSDGLADGTPARLLGRPVYDAVDMQNLVGTGSPVAATYPIAFGDFASMYQIIDRVGVQIMRDDFTGADNGIVKFRARRRVGGKVVLPEAVKLMKATVSGS